MAKNNETAILGLSLLITAGILGGGYWWLRQSGILGIKSPSTPSQPTATQPTATPSTLPPPPSPAATTAFALPNQVPSGTTITIDGSTSMVLINEALKQGFEQQFPNAQVNTNAKGSDKGILDLLTGKIDIAAISRPLTPEEQSQGLMAVPMMKDAIAIVVGTNNPFRKGLTQAQVMGIFQGKITNWSEVGGKNIPLRVINRPPISGTHQAFQSLVLNGGVFGTGANFTTMQRDATTPILQALETDGISYATYAQVANQQTVRTVAVDGLTPEAGNYPYQRTLYYVYKQPANPSVQAFLGYAGSSQAQSLIQQANQ